MSKHIRLLDCTLRDGGHINQGDFGKVVITNTIERLVEAGVDIIEAGFLWDKSYGTDIARYHSIKDLKRILPDNMGRSKISLMADFIDLHNLEPNDGTVEYIRLSFKRFRLDWGLKNAEILMNKGYKVFINPVNNNVYSDKEYIEVLEKVNKLHPYGFSIVDTFGVMRTSDLSHRYFLVENNLLPDITIGLHLHENLGLALALAQHFINIANPMRKIVIDGSLLGMGRVPGNLCIEQIMDYLNERYNSGYKTESVYDAIDDYIMPIKQTIDSPWGYATPYALSAKFNLHRTYAEYLMEKKRLKTKDIKRILMQIDKSEAEMFNEKYIEELYLNYMNVVYDDREDINQLKENISKYKRIVIIAPGKSVVESKEKIINMSDNETCFIAVNFCPEFIKKDNFFVFLSNIKRYDSIKNSLKNIPLIISSNLTRDIEKRDYVVNYNSLAYFNNEYCSDSTMMLLNLLSKTGVNKVFIFGFDGLKNGNMFFYDSHYNKNERSASKKEIVRRILSDSLKNINVVFLTESEYEENNL